MNLLTIVVILTITTTTVLALTQSINAKEYLTDFNYGTHDLTSNTRNFTLIVEENQSIPITSSNSTQPVMFPAWTFNGTVPGPTMRMTQGDHVAITVINDAKNKHHHSLHMHSIHPPEMDGTLGPSGSIAPGESFTYRFIAGPVGLFPYHCHVEPVVDHINRGLYGAIIIDPLKPRPPALEMVMMMNSYDLDLNEELAPTFRTPTSDEASQIMGINSSSSMEPIVPTDGMTMNTVIESNTASQISNNDNGGDGGDSNDGGGDSGSSDNDSDNGNADSGNDNTNSNNDGSGSSDNDGGSNSGSDSNNGSGGDNTSDSSNTGDEETTTESLTTTENETTTTADDEPTSTAAETETGPELEVERDNEFYTLNGRAFQYADNPIQVKVGEPIRIYLLSMTEFDPVNSFHLHAGMFNYTSSGTMSTPSVLTDVVTLGQGDRGILEFTPMYRGKMMIHAHINEFTTLGWMAFIEVT